MAKSKSTNQPRQSKRTLSKKVGKFHRVKLTHDKRGSLLTINGRHTRDYYRFYSDTEARQYYHGIKRVRDIEYLQSH